mgnify:CR=1 FL=1
MDLTRLHSFPLRRYTNIASIFANLNSFTLYVHQQNPDRILSIKRIVVITSYSKLSNDYNIYRTDRTSRRGGLCIFLKSSVFKQFAVTSYSKNVGKIELVGVEVRYCSYSFVLFCVYRPPDGSIVDD